MRHRRRRAVVIAASTAVSTAKGTSAALESKNDSERQNDIRDIYEAQEKDRRLLAELEKKRDGAASVLTQAFAKALLSEQFNVDGMFSEYRKWEAEDDQLGQQIDAFTDLHAMLMARWALFKIHCPKDVLTVLTIKLEHMGQMCSRREAEAQSLQKRIEKLTAEIQILANVSPNVESRAGAG